MFLVSFFFFWFCHESNKFETFTNINHSLWSSCMQIWLLFPVPPCIRFFECIIYLYSWCFCFQFDLRNTCTFATALLFIYMDLNWYIQIREYSNLSTVKLICFNGICLKMYNNLVVVVGFFSFVGFALKYLSRMCAVGPRQYCHWHFPTALPLTLPLPLPCTIRGKWSFLFLHDQHNISIASSSTPQPLMRANN